MSINRQFSKSLAIALNYRVPSFGALGSSESENLRSISSHYATTLYHDFKFGYLTPTDNAGYNSYSLFGASLHVQDPSDEDIVLQFFDGENPMTGISFTLLAGETSAKLNDGNAAPAASGLDPANSYYVKCVQSSTPTVKAQGAQLNYFLYRI